MAEKRRSGPNSFYINNPDIEDEQEQEQEQDIGPGIEATQDAFTPIFTVVQDEIPESSQVHVPTEEEQKSTLDTIYKKLGIAAKEFLESEPLEITPQINENVKRGSLIAARIFSAISMWGFSVFGVEYGQAAPTVDHSVRMIEPLIRIAARHTPIVGKISPDVEDAIESATAMSDYGIYAMAIMQQIREDKQQNGGRYTGAAYRPTTGETRFGSNGSGPNDIPGFTTVGNEHSQDARDNQYSNTAEHLTTEQQYNREMLQQLSARDYQTRARRAGRL